MFGWKLEVEESEWLIVVVESDDTREEWESGRD